MKTPAVKNTQIPAPSSKPFFNKSGEGNFFSQPGETQEPFFNPPIIQPKLTNNNDFPIQTKSIEGQSDISIQNGQPLETADGSTGGKVNIHNVNTNGNHHLIQRMLSVDTTEFTPEISRQMPIDRFKQMIVSELRAVTGLPVQFTGNSLGIQRGPRNPGGSATAAGLLQRVISSQRNLFINPTLGPTRHLPGTGRLVLNITPPTRVLQAMRTGIIILHELSHEFAADLLPANYVTRMETLHQRFDAAQQQSGGRNLAGRFSTEEVGQYMEYKQDYPQYDENIPIGIENTIRSELGIPIKRVAYRVDLEFPMPPASARTPLERLTPYTMFEVLHSSPRYYIYQRVRDGELFCSPVDFVQEFLGTGQPAIPTSAQMQPIANCTAHIGNVF